MIIGGETWLVLNLEWKYVLALILILSGLILLALGKVTFEQAMAIIGAGIALLGANILYKSWKAGKLVI
jgi:hypothetical protein